MTTGGGAGLAAVDWLLLAMLALSVGVGVWRGFTREAFSLAIWVAAFVVANVFAQALSSALASQIASPSLRFPIAFATLFIMTLMLGTLLARFLGALVQAAGLTRLDRGLGVLFGAARAGLVGVVIAAVAEPLFGTTGWWQESALLPYLAAAEDRTLELIGGFFGAVDRAAQW